MFRIHIDIDVFAFSVMVHSYYLMSILTFKVVVDIDDFIYVIYEPLSFFILLCFSITTCGYIVLQLFQVSYQDPIYHVLLNSHSKYGTATSL